jgi:hypothetical protein
MTTDDYTITVGTYERVSRLKDEGSDQRDRERSVEQQRVANERACARRRCQVVWCLGVLSRRGAQDVAL